MVRCSALGALCVAWGCLSSAVGTGWCGTASTSYRRAARDQLTVLHLSDLHFVRRRPAKAAFLASLPPADVTVVTGDFLAEPEAVETVVAALRPARGRLASWFVLGSNDYFVPKPLNYLAYFPGKRRPRAAEGARART